MNTAPPASVSAGGLPAFELVECALAHAQDLAHRHFPPVDDSATLQATMTLIDECYTAAGFRPRPRTALSA